jgi:redox-sensitive bicupin YhaK (pirin superfamily)
MPLLRSIADTVKAEATSDGAGVKLNRTIATQSLPVLDPFLLLDEFNTENPDDYVAGFPDHPHRGFETVTYMVEGNMRHQDTSGGGGVLRSGGVQWMTAGRGIVHSEMPEQVDGRMQGFQLWVNLPASEKMTAPRYQEFDPADVPEATHEDGSVVRVIAGTHDGVDGPVTGINVEPIYLDVSLPPGATLSQPVPVGHNAFVYLFGGESIEITGENGPKTLSYRHLAILEDGDSLQLANTSSEAARLLVVAGAPIGEPIARYGPFVMNTEAEIHQAFKDFQEGRF